MKKAILFFVVLLLILPGAFAEEEVQELAIIAKQWEFFPSIIRVKKDVPVKVYLTTVDVPHGFKLPDLKVPSAKLTKGEIITLTFTPTKVGNYTFACSVFCGENHKKMNGRIIVEE